MSNYVSTPPYRAAHPRNRNPGRQSNLPPAP